MERYTPEFKARVVMEALATSATDTSIAQAYGVHPVTLSRWKTQFVRNAGAAFGEPEDSAGKEAHARTIEELERARAELALLASLVDAEVSIDAKVEAVRAHKDTLGLNRALELFGLPKSTYYYRMG